MDGVTVRRVRAEEWSAARDLHLAALREPTAPLTATETSARTRARPESSWRERAHAGAAGKATAQFVAALPGGELVGTARVLLPKSAKAPAVPGGTPRGPYEARLDGLLVRERYQAGHVPLSLLRATLAWTRGQQPSVTSTRLLVHADNTRAHALCRRAGFRTVGVVGAEREMEWRAEGLSWAGLWLLGMGTRVGWMALHG